MPVDCFCFLWLISSPFSITQPARAAAQNLSQVLPFTFQGRGWALDNRSTSVSIPPDCLMHHCRSLCPLLLFMLRRRPPRAWSSEEGRKTKMKNIMVRGRREMGLVKTWMGHKPVSFSMSLLAPRDPVFFSAVFIIVIVIIIIIIIIIIPLFMGNENVVLIIPVAFPTMIFMSHHHEGIRMTMDAPKMTPVCRECIIKESKVIRDSSSERKPIMMYSPVMRVTTSPSATLLVFWQWGKFIRSHQRWPLTWTHLRRSVVSVQESTARWCHTCQHFLNVFAFRIHFLIYRCLYLIVEDIHHLVEL